MLAYTSISLFYGARALSMNLVQIALTFIYIRFCCVIFDGFLSKEIEDVGV